MFNKMCSLSNFVFLSKGEANPLLCFMVEAIWIYWKIQFPQIIAPCHQEDQYLLSKWYFHVFFLRGVNYLRSLQTSIVYEGNKYRQQQIRDLAPNSHSLLGERVKQEGDVNVGYLIWGLQVTALDSHECGKSLSPQAKWIADDGK